MEKGPGKTQSNEEIIEELTKDLESSCIKTQPGTAEKHNETGVKTNPSDEPWDNLGEEKDEEKEDRTKNEVNEEDFVDEEFLKDREIGLSGTEKEELKNEADRLKNEGNALFKSGDYEKAKTIYTQGLRTCSLAYSKERSILYANRAAAKAKSASEKESAIADCTKAIELNSSYVKAYVRRAQLYEETDKLDEALEDFKKILTFDPAHADANYAVRRLPPLIQEKNEKLKEEMLGKLKDLGNMVLKPFGLSTNNFELQKDSNSGGYSVKFHQSPR